MSYNLSCEEITYGMQNLGADKDLKVAAKVAADLAQTGKFPPEGMKIIAFHATPSTPIWGITIYEADSEEAVFNSRLLWMKAMPGFFSFFRVSPALPIEKQISLILS
jgi:hypothetical protein